MRSCLVWRGNTDRDGYGLVKVGTQNVRAHRRMYELWYGVKLKPGQVVMHKCDNPPCFNPLHLDVGTMLDNTRDMDAKGRRVNYEDSVTHCPMGHAYDNVNTYVDPKGKRRCRECSRINRRKRG